MREVYTIYKSRLSDLPALRKISAEGIKSLFLFLAAFSLALDYRFTTISLILFGVISLYTAIRQKTTVNYNTLIYTLPPTLFYLWYAAGFFYSDNQNESLRDLETKFSLLALPLFIGILNQINNKKLTVLFSSFIAGLLCMMLISLVNAVTEFIKDGDLNVFFYHQLVRLSDLNAAYFSWYLLFSLIILIFYKLPFPRPVIVSVIIFQILFLVLLSSRASQLVFSLIIIPFAFYFYRNEFKNILFRLSALIYILTLSIGFVYPTFINERFDNFNSQQAKQAFLTQYDHYSYEFNNVSTRLFFWRTGIENILDNNLLIGIGNGDVSQVQNQRMHVLGIKDIYNKENPSDFVNMNLHNMYLQALLSSGLIGLILLLAILILPLILAIRTKNFLLLMFQITSILFMIHESAFQTQAGVVFYCFFSLILVSYSRSDMKTLLSGSIKRESYKADQKIAKRVFDISVSIIILVPFSLLILPVCAILIKLSSPGPVFFTQRRTGARHCEFLCYKLRTMKLNREADLNQATENDKRITRIGHFLRITHIDEIPQLFNVLKGDMSIIGPRPHMLHHTKIYSERVTYYHIRLNAKPGLTGLAQVKGYIGEIRHESDLKMRVLSDIYFIKNSSFKLSFYILIMTAGNIIKKLINYQEPHEERKTDTVEVYQEKHLLVENEH